MSLSDHIIQPAAVLGQGSSGSGGGVSPPFAISDTTGLQAALDAKQGTPLSAPDIPPYYGVDASRASTNQTLTGGIYNAVDWEASVGSSGTSLDGTDIYPGRVGYWDYSGSILLGRSATASARELNIRLEINGSILPQSGYQVIWAGDSIAGLQISGGFLLSNAGHAVSLLVYADGSDSWEILAGAFNWIQLAWRCPS